jgi:hypothetical protein
MNHTRALWLIGVIGLASCRGRPSPPAPPARAAEAGGPAARLARALPEAAAPFAAGPLLVADGYVRRRYQRGAVGVEVTVAALPEAAGGYDQWVSQSRDYPQATLPLPAAAANGFYTGGDGGAGCSLHIQTRAGFHVEVMGGGDATCADLDQLVTRLPLGTVAVRPALHISAAPTR